MKRKIPLGFLQVRTRSLEPWFLVVLGDDPKPEPKPRRRERKLLDERTKPFYNHYESGCGWRDGDREGVDGEELGCNDVWEGMGSTTLGGFRMALDWKLDRRRSSSMKNCFIYVHPNAHLLVMSFSSVYSMSP